MSDLAWRSFPRQGKVQLIDRAVVIRRPRRSPIVATGNGSIMGMCMVERCATNPGNLSRCELYCRQAQFPNAN